METLTFEIAPKRSTEGDEIPQSVIEKCIRIASEAMEGMEYEAYVQRIIDSGNETAIRVKLNDLHHNIARGKAYGYDRLVAKHSRALEMIEATLRC